MGRLFIMVCAAHGARGIDIEHGKRQWSNQMVDERSETISLLVLVCVCLFVCIIVLSVLRSLNNKSAFVCTCVGGYTFIKKVFVFKMQLCAECAYLSEEVSKCKCVRVCVKKLKILVFSFSFFLTSFRTRVCARKSSKILLVRWYSFETIFICSTSIVTHWFG